MNLVFDNVKTLDPTSRFVGSTTFIVGGGSSLKGFPFKDLTGRCVIGVNEAFRLGSATVPITIFGDATWFHRVKWDLERYTGKVVCVAPSLAGIQAKWLTKLRRVKGGLGSSDSLPWYASTGSSAIALAIQLGALRVVLLGFDMLRIKNNTHWHNYGRRRTDEKAFARHIEGMGMLAEEIRKNSSVGVINLTNESRIDAFPKVSMDRFKEFLT